ncbi:MAG: Nif3-like dinuclear metal center hexameric protein [Bacteroidales bacterium]|nr:Nif3-like dinuclear metal center hexameric protein [Bacteroidales bacterium]
MTDTTTIQQVVSHLDATFRPEVQEDYDNSGFLLGHSDTACTGALVALDLTATVVEEAIELGFNLIVTHHPFIFSGLKRITDQSASGRLVLTLAEHGISVYAAHTNLDNLPWGVSGALAQRLGLQDCRVLSPLGGDTGAGTLGSLPSPMEADRFLRKVKEVTGLPTVRCSQHSPGQLVQRIALCGGSGSFLIGNAIDCGADIYLTADIKYHDFERATSRLILADIGHYESEQFAKEIISRSISEKFSNFACRISAKQEGIVYYI